MDFVRRISFFTMDVITEIAFGQSWGCLLVDADIGGWFASMELVMPNAFKASTIPRLADLVRLPFIGRFIMPSEKDKTGPGRMIAVAKEVVRKRFAEDDPGRHRDMMGSFIRHGISQREAVSEATLQM